MAGFVQLALDFLTGTAPLAAPPPAPAPPSRNPDPAAPPAEPLSVVFQPGTWHHPRANRLLRLGSCEVAYEFKRGKRRTIGLTVTPDGLTVSAPRWTPLGEVEALLKQKSPWLLDKLQQARERAAERQRSLTVWADGAELDFLGQRVRLRLDPAHGFSAVGAVLEPAAEGHSGDAGETGDAAGPAILKLGLARNASEAQIRDAAQAWLMRQAKRVFAERLDHFAPRLGVSYKVLRLSSAGTRWGSAAADGTIRLNWRLIHLKPEMIDYVVVHELSHLRHMDHSPQFWGVVASILPDHAERRKALRQAAARDA